QLTGIQQPSFVHATAKIGENVYIGAFAYIGENVIVSDGAKIYPNAYLGNNVTIGKDTVINPGATVYHDCIVGKSVIIHAGAVIGSDGFGFAPETDGSFKKIPQIGNVIIEDYVEIGANTTIDRATIGSTLIKSGAKLDNLLQIAHNVEVGNNTAIAALTGVSGSTKIGKNVIIGGQAGLAGHLQIADGTKINGKSGVSKSIKTPNTSVTGTPAIDYAASMRSQAVARNLPALEKKVIELEKMLKELIKKTDV
ncbi:MAG: UDP-3-O-(3-hydroxymyristoyl)glucosamine N-acyltransferase, partial [Ferruginibacter sp.]